MECEAIPSYDELHSGLHLTLLNLHINPSYLGTYRELRSKESELESLECSPRDVQYVVNSLIAVFTNRAEEVSARLNAIQLCYSSVSFVSIYATNYIIYIKGNID